MREESEGALDFDEILKERDLFKLAVLGHAAVEDLIDSAIAEVLAEPRQVS